MKSKKSKKKKECIVCGGAGKTWGWAAGLVLSPPRICLTCNGKGRR